MSGITTSCKRKSPVRGLQQRDGEFRFIARYVFELQKKKPRQGIATLSYPSTREGDSGRKVAKEKAPSGDCNVNLKLEAYERNYHELQKKKPRQGIATRPTCSARAWTTSPCCKRKSPVRGLQLVDHDPYQLLVGVYVAKEKAPSGDCNAMNARCQSVTS